MDAALDWSSHKFTDRDVRDHPILVDVARQYLLQYTGDFEFLLDMRRKLDHLTIPQARGVLNCMRNDPRATNALTELLKRLPRMPELPAANGDGEFEAEVVDIKVKMKPTCNITQPHESHYIDKARGMCRGVPFEINREYYFARPATIKLPFAMARTGSLIHAVAASGSKVQWFPPIHHYGFGRCELWVKTMCRYPSSIRNPKLLTPEKASVMRGLLGLEWCRHCVKEVSAWHEQHPQPESESSSLSKPDPENSGASVAPASRTVPKLVFMQPNAAPSDE